jgi:hypothetical protein
MTTERRARGPSRRILLSWAGVRGRHLRGAELDLGRALWQAEAGDGPGALVLADQSSE